jgi:PAS domain S-box-containing protein
MEATHHSNVDIGFEPSGKVRGKFLVADTETTGLITKQFSGANDRTNLPRVIQVAWLLFDEDGKRISAHNRYLFQDQPIPAQSTRIHGIDDASVHQKGESATAVWSDFVKDLENCEYFIGHNIDFDLPVIEGELQRLQINNAFAGKKMICTMKQGKAFCRIPAADGHGFRYPDLEELYKIAYYGRLTDQPITGLHDAYVDAAITAKVFFRLLETHQIILADAPEEPFQLPLFPEKTEIVRNKFFIHIILPTLLTIILFLLTIFTIIIPRFRENIMLGKREMIKELTNSASSILEKYQQDEQHGLMSREEAQRTAISRIRYLRYGEENKDYFWITDMKPEMVMHPYRADLDGTSLTTFADPHGKKLFVEMVSVARKNGQGYVDYMWQWKDDTAHIVPKLSYVKAFKPWGWIIGTGIYLEDVKKEIRMLTQRLLFTTLGIALLIAMLLTYITLQSMKIEWKRKKAESLLQVSREKYKTLVDATTEGLIMIIDRKIIFSNNHLHALSGYSEQELLNQSLPFLFSSKNKHKVMELFKGRELPDGQFELILTCRDGHEVEAVLSITSILFYEKQGKLVTVKDASVHKHPDGKTDDLMHLLGFAGLGFIRVLLDDKGKIIHAGPSVLKLLGFESLQELSKYSFLDFFIDPAEKKQYRKQLLTDGRIKSPSIRIRRKDGAVLTISVSMIVVKNETEQVFGDGIITDLTKQLRETREMEEMVSRLDAHSHLLQAPVSPLIIPVGDLPMETPVAQVIGRMKRTQTDAILVSNNTGAKIGIITAGDITDRILLADLGLQKPAWEIMSAPLIQADCGITMQQALTRMKAAGISHLAIKNPAGEIRDVVQLKDILRSLVNSYAYIGNQIDGAQTTDELASLFQEFRKYMRIMIKHNLPPDHIGESMASISDRITKRMIVLACEEIGNPPAEFAFIALGSEGRMEQTLATDQDNAIIFKDVADEDLEKVQVWFNRLAEIVCNNLDTTGYSFCRGRIMAKNPQWCQPLKTWKRYFSQWISNTEPKNLMDVSIFFDLRTVYGNSMLTDELRQHINQVSDGNGSFFYNLAENVLSFRSGIGLTGNIHTDRKEDKDFINLKNAVTPYIMFGRIYSIYHKINQSNTAARFRALSEYQVIPPALHQDILFGYHFLMQLRYRHQVSCLEKNQEINNAMPMQDLTQMEETFIKKILAQSAELQNKLNIDFKSSVM